jgi:hypothetical protein
VDAWRFTVTAADRPLEIFNARRDIGAMTWVRPSEEDRTPGYRLLPGETSEGAALSLGIPQLKVAPAQDHYAGALYIGERVAARGPAAAQANRLSVRLRAGGGAAKTLEVLLIEKDGSSWRGSVLAGPQWSTAQLALDGMTFARSVLTPTPYPGTWNYWRQGPAARAGGKIRPENVERLELRVGRVEGEAPAVEVASVQLHFAAPK